jgi:3-methylcrotonyl-CoA carboxylase alpha subunit
LKTRSFKKILIANRGEIALRVMRTCRNLGIVPIAVYSEADTRSLHARQADQAICIGPAPSRQSYLNIDSIIEAALRCGADAIHPGYGFLSENPEFAAACEASGITFIGPSAETIRNMGLKSVAKRLVAEHGVPVVPGYAGEDQGFETLSAQATAIGFPVLIKASAGGGGKGMRVVRDQGKLAESLESARREAEKSFGDGTLLIEKYVDGARHVEVQILGDLHGNLIHLFERDCSIQRRHQKIIEETPSPTLTDTSRTRMTEAALAVARAINYYSAGTVEFIVAPSGEFFFIEVNTRLQVEHTVTEMVTGLDLVQLQIEIAAGKPLPFTQQEIHPRGNAIEARLYAEDPGNDFLPSTGTIRDWNAPDSIVDLRIDAGVETGSEVGIYYDPMLAKLIAHGADRESALRRLTYGLTSLSVLGVRTNKHFLIRLLEHPSFAAGEYDTAFIDNHVEQLLSGSTNGGSERDERMNALAALVMYIEMGRQEAAPRLRNIPLNYRNNPYKMPFAKFEIGGERFEVKYNLREGNSYFVESGDWQGQVRVVSCSLGTAASETALASGGRPGLIRIETGGLQRSYRVIEEPERFLIHSVLGDFEVVRIDRLPRPVDAADPESTSSPMPGQVLKILVTQGQKVSAGEALIVLEAMKMEQTLRAAAAGTVEAILVAPGDVVAPGDELIRIAYDAE